MKNRYELVIRRPNGSVSFARTWGVVGDSGEMQKDAEALECLAKEILGHARYLKRAVAKDAA